MTSKLDVTLTSLYDSYSNHPVIKSLIQVLSIYGIPLGSLSDNFLGIYVTNLKNNRLRCFFEELENGQIELTEDIISQNDFLSAYFSTVNYVIRTRSDNKIKCFARILKNIGLGKIDINEFEDYTAILNDLSEREFAILSIKHKYELENSESDKKKLNPAQLTETYWLDFENKVCQKIGLSKNEFEPMLVRLQRTGCYNKHKGFWDDGPNEKGDTTELFKRLYELIK